jgi:prephenate dehydratase
LVFVTTNVPGALFKCMSAFALRDINLTKIESRPLKGRPFEYRFYVDILASPDEANCANAMRHLEEMTEFLAVLGCYRPASVAERRRPA